MKAVRYHGLGADPVLEEAPEPAAAAGESLVEVVAAAVTPLDLTVAGGEFQVSPDLPYVGGAEGMGTILESDTFPLGSPVTVHGGGVGLARDGLWAERAAVPNLACIPVPADIEPALAAAYLTSSLTAYAAVHETGRLSKGERVAVTGAAGSVGALAVQLALRGGAREVVGIARTAERARLVPDGARAAVWGPGDPIDEVRGENGIDLLVDTVGGQPLAGLLRGAMRPGGRAVLVGYMASTELDIDVLSLLLADVSLHPVNLPNQMEALLPESGAILRRLHDGDLTMRLTRLGLAELPARLDDLRSGRIEGRLVVEPSRP